MTGAPDDSDYDAALAYLHGRIDYERNTKLPYRSRGLKLDRMRELAAGLGNPQLLYPVIHVAGTKGKGSTASMLAAILTAAGYRTGLYTSPHLECVEERMAVDGHLCRPQELVELLRAVRPLVDTLDLAAAQSQGGAGGPTYFEITTATAILHFQRQAVDAAVLEVGLGGRLDSTNICQPEISVITSISFDHTQQLGNTLTAIAEEKAGIIKPGVPVVSGVTAAEPRAAIERIAEERGCRCFGLDRDFHVHYRGSQLPAERLDAVPGSGATLDYEEHCGPAPLSLPGLSLAMLGRHQAHNAAVAVATVCRLREAGWEIPETAIRAGIAQVHCPARTEVVGRHPTVLLDAAHNVASSQALIDVLDESFTSCRRRILIFAVSRDKDAAGILACLLPAFDVLVLTRFLGNPRYTDPNSLAETAERILAAHPVPNRTVLVRPNASSAWQTARALAVDDDLICIAGSFFLAAELRPMIASDRDPKIGTRGALAP